MLVKILSKKYYPENPVELKDFYTVTANVNNYNDKKFNKFYKELN